MDAIARYFEALFIDGDWLNDWLTHLPPLVAMVVCAIGRIVSIILGL